ncbi:MAG: hypothetical protein WC674_02625 [Candidatus Krumholzibacteriia bacterium]
MAKRMIAFLLCALGVLLIVAFAMGAASTGGSASAKHGEAAAALAPAAYTLEGCWAYFAAGPCYDIYRDGAGNYWICLTCGNTTKPGPSQCKKITLQQLNRGYWCS